MSHTPGRCRPLGKAEGSPGAETQCSLQEQTVNYNNDQTSRVHSLADLTVLCKAGTSSS